LSIGNSKSNYLSAQGTFKRTRRFLFPSHARDKLYSKRAAPYMKAPSFPLSCINSPSRTLHERTLFPTFQYILLLSKPGGGNVTGPGVKATSSRCIVWGQYHSSEKVSCDKWYWNPSPDISGYMCGARRVVRGLAAHNTYSLLSRVPVGACQGRGVGMSGLGFTLTPD